ncbi:MAG: hypothetical protein JST73_12580, partial [Actinobacteria bacterium]|nr:hypothetical protein [Actinomycetota bacterium]
LLGTVIAFLVERGSLDGGAIFLLAIGAGGTAWMLQAIAWTALDTQAHSAFTPWVLAVAHLVFAVGTATVLTRLEHRGVTDTAPSPLTGAADVAIVAPVSVPRATRSGFSRRIGEGVGDADALEA